MLRWVLLVLVTLWVERNGNCLVVLTSMIEFSHRSQFRIMKGP